MWGSQVPRARHGGVEETVSLGPDHRCAVELPGTFFKWSALFYPVLHPNWIRLIGLSFMSTLAFLMVAGAAFVFSVIMRFGAFVSLFAVPTMAMGCLALVSYVVGCFVTVIEETANGDDRLDRLIDLSWWETLPRFLATAGAAGVAVGLAVAATYPLRRWFVWNDFEMILIHRVIIFQAFPILLITNLVDGSWLPIRSLLETVRRLSRCIGYFVAFLLITAPFSIATDLALAQLYQWNLAAALFGAGPLGAAWLMFYGHWLGRLSRQLTAAE